MSEAHNSPSDNNSDNNLNNFQDTSTNPFLVNDLYVISCSSSDHPFQQSNVMFIIRIADGGSCIILKTPLNGFCDVRKVNNWVVTPRRKKTHLKYVILKHNIEICRNYRST